MHESNGAPSEPYTIDTPAAPGLGESKPLVSGGCLEGEGRTRGAWALFSELVTVSYSWSIVSIS
jgi:hypothetical protein